MDIPPVPTSSVWASLDENVHHTREQIPFRTASTAWRRTLYGWIPTAQGSMRSVLSLTMRTESTMPAPPTVRPVRAMIARYWKKMAP
jgi:hypothetical protein